MRVLSVKTSGYQGEKRKWVASKKGAWGLMGVALGFCVGAWKEGACFRADGESSIKERFGMQERDDRREGPSEGRGRSQTRVLLRTDLLQP